MRHIKSQAKYTIHESGALAGTHVRVRRSCFPLRERMRCKSVPDILCHRLVGSQKHIYDTSKTAKY